MSPQKLQRLLSRHDQRSRELAALEEVLDEQHRLQMANQHTLLRTRMMPVSSIVPRLQRSVRQTGRLLDKSVQFTVKGAKAGDKRSAPTIIKEPS